MLSDKKAIHEAAASQKLSLPHYLTVSREDDEGRQAAKDSRGRMRRRPQRPAKCDVVLAAPGVSVSACESFTEGLKVKGEN